jgi:hypothetical protein
VFLVGAYQEILGDLHNLFGDTHAVHVSLDEQGSVVLDAVIKGDTVKEVLDYVEFDADTLVRSYARTSSLRYVKGRSVTKRQAASSSSTKTACRDIPTSRIPKKDNDAGSGSEIGIRDPGSGQGFGTGEFCARRTCRTPASVPQRSCQRCGLRSGCAPSCRRVSVTQ